MADRIHHPRDVLRVGGGAAQQLAGADTVVVGGVEPKRVGKDRVAHARVRSRAVADREDVAHPAGDHLEQADSEQRQQPDDQRVPVARDDPVVDRVLDDQRRRNRARLPEQPGDDGADDAACLGANDRAYESPRRPATCLDFPHEANVSAAQTTLPA